MAKKHKFDAPEGTPEVVAVTAEVTAVAVNTEATDEPKKEAIKRGFHLVADTADLHGRTQYRFGKYSQMPKKAERMAITVDGEHADMAVTNSGGYAADKGYNGYIDNARGFIGWILFGHGVDPKNEEQFPNGLNFVTVDGSCPENPIRTPANMDNELKRRAAASEAAKKRAAEKAAAKAAAEAAAAANEPQAEQTEVTA